MCAEPQPEFPMVRTENDRIVRFTQRGVDELGNLRGFVRIAGKTITGFVTSKRYFYADLGGVNADLAMN